MRTRQLASPAFGRLTFLIVIIAVAVAAVFALRATAQEARRIGDFSTSTATASTANAALGETVTYTLVARNSSGVAAPHVYARQLLTTGQTFVSAVVVTTTQATESSFVGNSGGITWTGSISASGAVTMSLRVTVDPAFAGATLDTAFEIASAFANTTKPLSVRVASRGLLHMPVIMRAPSIPTLQEISDPSDGSYTVSWINTDSTTTGLVYVLEESTSADFSSFTVIFTGSALSHDVTGKTGGTFYYRVKARGGTLESLYSNVVSASVSSLKADSTNLSVGNCTALRWTFTSIKAISVKLGKGYDFTPTSGEGSATVCPAVTTTYEVKVTLNDDSVVTHQETINVSGSGCGDDRVDPYINKFESNKTSVVGSDPIELSWDAQCARSIQLLVDFNNDGGIDETHNVVGTETRSDILPSTTRYILKVYRMNSTTGGFVETSIIVIRN